VRPAISDANRGVDLAWLAERIEYRRFQDCVHCGLCTASCPTYVETGDENDGPRGRIYLMRAVTDGRLALSGDVRKHLDLCLDCRACETACPSGVQYGRLIEPFKVAMQQSRSDHSSERAQGWLLDSVLKHVFPYAGRVRLALLPARIMKRLGLYDVLDRIGFFRMLPGSLGRLVQTLPRRMQKAVRLPRELPALGTRRARVALFTGCVGDALLPQTNAATARVLQRNGCDVIVPSGQVCCGAIHYHAGDEAPALELARKNLQVFDPEEYDAIITNAAGCGAMLKDYAHQFRGSEHAQAASFASKVKDVSEFLVALGAVAPTRALSRRVAFHDACHLCHAQQIRSQPRQLLQMIPGLELVPLEESELCCGAAGTYNLTQPEMSERLGKRKLEKITETGAPIVATGNVGCILQIERMARAAGVPLEVVHPIDLLDQAYSGEG
jgi:glycolate oxidase iron-sulfur subunit